MTPVNRNITVMFLLLLGALLALLLFHNFYWKRRNLPPGPTPWPLLGNIPTMRRETERWERQFDKWAQKYGPVYTFWFGERPMVGFNSLETLQKYFVKQADLFVDRPVNQEMMKLIRGGQYGLIMTSGARWQEQRRFTLRVLRDFGLGKNAMEERVCAMLGQ